MKKILALLLALAMVLAFAACGSKADDTAEAAPAAEAPAAEAAPAPEAAPAADDAVPAVAEPAAGASGEMGGASGEAAASTEPGASGETGGAQAGNALDLSVNAHIPTADDPETYTADEAGWKEYMMDCAYYAMGTSDSDNKLGATYYDISVGNMTDMFVNMWGVDAMDAFIANGGAPAVQPWSLTEGQGTPDTVPDETAAE